MTRYLDVGERQAGGGVGRGVGRGPAVMLGVLYNEANNQTNQCLLQQQAAVSMDECYRCAQ